MPSTRLSWIMLLMIFAPCTFGQDRGGREQRQIELYQEALRSAADQLSVSPTDPTAVDVAALGQYALAQLGRAANPAATDARDRFASGLYKSADRFSRKLAETLTNDVGRWIGSSDEAVLVFLSLDRDTVFYAPSQLDARGERLARAISVLEQYDVSVLGRFNIETNEAARQVLEDATWVLDQERRLVERLATITSYERDMPGGVDVSSLPTLRDAIDDYIGTVAARERLVEESARERERREALERRREMAAQSERERIDIELRRRQQLGRLSQTILEREYDLQVVTAEQQIQQRDSWIARELSDLQRKKTELELELAKRDEQIQALRNEIDVLSAKSAVRELPAEVRGLVRLLTAAGTWKPESRSPRTLVPNASYGVDPQSHSLSALVSVGALDPTPEGVYALYAVMANGSTDRPRYGGSWQVPDGGYGPDWSGVDITAAINQDRPLYDRVKKVQDALRKWGEELVEAGLLKP
jgi:hypothetical protein